MTEKSSCPVLRGRDDGNIILLLDGKTQLAVEYAYRHRAEYAAVLWVRADTVETLHASFGELARELDLPEKDAREQELVVRGVQRWLRHERNYLLILDNADRPEILPPFVPTDPGGHLLITTRAATIAESGLGLAPPLPVETLTPEQGAQLLLQRAGRLSHATPEERTRAEELSRELGGLPLALDQAGAYMHRAQISPTSYLERYRQHRLKLLTERHNQREHPESVVTTWSISFQAIERRHPAAADLLRFCAFLAPEAIPERILTAGVAELGPRLAPVAADTLLLDEAIGALRGYSLIERNGEGESATVSVHRLVQAVVRESLPKKQRQTWMRRSIGAVAKAYPGPDFVSWPMMNVLLPHHQQCAAWAEQPQLETVVAANLLNQAGYYLDDRGRYREAEPLYERALAIRERELGTSHPHTAISLNNLAALYRAQGRYGDAEPLYQRAIEIDTHMYGAEHPDVAIDLNNLARLYQAQSRYGEAEPLYKQALAIHERELGANHPNTAGSLNNLAELYRVQGRYREAEPLYERALAIHEGELGASHPNTATSLNNLALLYYAQGRYGDAEPLYQRALAIRERELGAKHPDTANSLNNLAALYEAQGRYEEAEPLYKQALAICLSALGQEHPNTIAIARNYSGMIDKMRGKLE